MSAETAFVYFIKPMMVAFRDPPSGDPEAFFQALALELAAFSQYQLEAGARQLRRDRVSRTFPTMAECIGACERWTKEAPQMLPPSEGLAPSDDQAAWKRKADAYALMRRSYDFARQASRDGWLGQMLDYAMENGRLPPPEAACRLQAEAERVRNELIACSGPIGLTLIDAYRTRYRSIQQAVLTDEYKKIEEAV